MATIGNSAGHKIYVVHSTYPIPYAPPPAPSFSDSDFIDYTSRFVQWRVSHKMNNLAMFTGKAALNSLAVSPSGSGTIADDIKANNYLYVMSGTKLISKFVIGKPIYDTTGFCEISGVQSSGREEKTFMHRVNTHQKRFDQETLLNIFFDDPTYAICADESGDKFLSNLELDSSTDQMSISIDYENRMAALSKATRLAKREWIISHGENDATPYSEGDGVRIENRVGSAGSLKTLILDGVDRNAKVSSGTTEIETAANQIIVKGKDQYGRQINSNIYDSTRRYKTETAATLDGWLAEDCTATDGIATPFTTLKLEPGHGFGSVGSVSCGIMYVRIDNELIRCVLSGDELVVWPDGGDTGRGVSVPGLTYCTMPCAHKAGADVILVRDEDVSTSTDNYIKLYLQVPGDVFDTLAELRVGTETMRMISQGSDGWGDYILMWRLNAILDGNGYAHSEDMICLRSVYTADDPDSDLNSINVNGLMSQTFNDNSANNKDALDHKAYSILQNKQELTKRIAIDISNPLDVWEDINYNERSPLGSKVTLAETDGINLPAGGYRIVEYEYSWPTPKLILYLNSNDIRIYATGSYDFIEAFDEAESPKRQEPSRSSILLKEALGSPGEDSFEMFGQKLSNLITPREAWDEAGIDPAVYLPTLSMSQDAANAGASVGYVMALSGGSAYWDLDGSGNLRPKISHNVVPHTPTNDLGRATNRWEGLYATKVDVSGSQSTFEAPSASGVAVMEIKTTYMGGGDVLRAGYNTTLGAQSEGWNFRVNETTIGAYNGPIMFQHENPAAYLQFWFGSGLNDWVGFQEASEKLQYTEDGAQNWFNLTDIGLWEISAGNLRPKASYDVVPYSSGTKNLGSSTFRWDSLYIDGYIYGTAITLDSTNDLVLEFHSQKLTFQEDIIYPYNTGQFDLGNLTHAFNDIFSASINIIDTAGNVWRGSFEPYLTNDALLKAITGDLHLKGYDDVIITAEGTGSAGDIKLFAQNGGDITLDADTKLNLYWDTANSRELIFDGTTVAPNSSNVYNFGSSTYPFLNMHSNKFEVYNAAVTKGYISNYSTNDMIVYASAGDLYFRDNSNTTPISLTTLAAGGTTYWSLSVSDLKPVGAYHVLPYSSGQNLGQTGTSATWNKLYLYSECHFPYGYIKGDVATDQLDFYCGSTKVTQMDTTLGTTCGRFQSQKFACVKSGESTERLIAVPESTVDGALRAPTGYLYLDGFTGVAIYWANAGNYLGFYDINIYPDTANKLNMGTNTYPFKEMHSNKVEIHNVAVTKGYLSTINTSDIELKATVANLKLIATTDVDITGVNCDIDVTGYADIYADTSITLDSNIDLQLDASDDLQLYAGDDLTLRWGTNSDNLLFDGGSRAILPSVAGIINLGSSAAELDNTYSCDFHGNTNASTCDLAEIQFVSDEVKPGDVVELCEWDSDEDKYFMEEVEICKSKPCKHIKYFGMQGKWKKASKGSTKCPSVISTDPGNIMGGTELRNRLVKEGKMNYVALSGSIPFVFIKDKFTSGDILISAGDGKAMVDNTANSNQIVGYAKRNGNNERCEIWVR